MVYQCKIVKYNNDEEDMESTDVYFHSANRRIFHMEQFETEYDEAVDNINEKFVVSFFMVYQCKMLKYNNNEE